VLAWHGAAPWTTPAQGTVVPGARLKPFYAQTGLDIREQNPPDWCGCLAAGRSHGRFAG
jgi:hypothetical protein